MILLEEVMRAWSAVAHSKPQNYEDLFIHHAPTGVYEALERAIQLHSMPQIPCDPDMHKEEICYVWLQVYRGECLG